MPRLRVVLHDFTYQWGGAEWVLENILQADNRAHLLVVAGSRKVLRRHLPERSAEILYPSITSNLLARAAIPWLAANLPRSRAVAAARQLTVNSYAVARWLPSGAPRVVYLHSPMRQIWHGVDLYSRSLSPQAMALRLMSPKLRRTDRAALQAGDRYFVPSSRIGQLVSDIYGIEPSVLPPPIPDSAFAQIQSRTGNVDLIWVGRIVEPVKRIAMLLETMRRLPQRRLLMVGDGRHYNWARRRAPRNVRFVGWQSRDQVLSLMREAKLLVLPSMEDFGMCAAEAMAVGTPVAVSSLAGIADHVVSGLNGIVLGTDVGDWVEALSVDHRMGTREEISTSVAHLSQKHWQRQLKSAWAETYG